MSKAGADANGGDERDGESDQSARRFIRELVSPATALGGVRELGTTALARQLSLAEDQLSGHWCSRCAGIWYGCALEVQCPVCGSRRG